MGEPRLFCGKYYAFLTVYPFIAVGQKEKIKSLESQLNCSRSSSQSSFDGHLNHEDNENKDLQAKLEAEVSQREQLEKKLHQLQEQQNNETKVINNACFFKIHLDHIQTEVVIVKMDAHTH